MDSLNPFTGIVATSYEMYQLMYPTLTENGADDFAPVPGLAESWEESADKTTWTYTIRSGLTWSDGQPLTARDAAYTFNRIMDGDYEQTNYGSYVANITAAEATDDTTLVLTVEKPSPLMENLAVYILPEHIWKEIDGDEVRSYENEPTDGQPIVGAGPFVLIERAKGQFLRFRSNPDYYDGPPAVDALTFRVYKNGDAVAQALRKGEIDFADEMQANVFDAIKDEAGITAVNAAYYGFNEIGMNVGDSPGRRHPDRRREPRPEGQAGAPGHQPRDRPPDPRRQGRRVRDARQHDHPAALRDPAPGADHALRLQPHPGRRACSMRPATPSAPTARASGPTASR